MNVPGNGVGSAGALDCRGRHAIVLGLGRFGGGLGVSRWLLGQGAEVTVTDRLPRAELAEAADELESLGARLALGGHEGLELAAADMLVVNPAVPLQAPLVQEARALGVALTSEIALLMERWPGPMLGVTGSNGKSTTVGMAHAILEAAGLPAVRGGNLGGSLLGQLELANEQTVAVLELSSFMLELLGELKLGPHVAVFTNLTPNHLDRHGTMEAYREAKAGILVRAESLVLPVGDCWLEPFGLGLQDGPAAALAAVPPPQVLWFGDVGGSRQPDLGVDGQGHLVDGQGLQLMASEDVPLPGRMNRWDAAAACLAVGALLGDHDRAQRALAAGLHAYQPAPHRLQQVARKGGVLWVDDSVSTTPESTAASLEAVGGPCLLIVGGRDKGLDPEIMVQAAVGRVRHALTIGELGSSLALRLNREGVDAEQLETVEAAVDRAAALARPGDTVLLSPGYSSHDQFVHFEERAAAFCAAVRALGGPRSLS